MVGRGERRAVGASPTAGAREGINYFDTADTYGSGKGETLLADAFGQMREEVVISTKIGYDFYNHTARRGQQERPQDWSEDFIRFALEQSLKAARHRLHRLPAAPQHQDGRRRQRRALRADGGVQG
jgi:diketogulonate reductase-like aldo/keto reductase